MTKNNNINNIIINRNNKNSNNKINNKIDNENNLKIKNEKIKLNQRKREFQKEQIQQLYTDVLLFVVMFIHVVVSPFTKVEESFNLQAMHDILNIGNIGSDEQGVSFKYDHLEFPGVIPRTFLGSLIVSILSYLPLKLFKNILNFTSNGGIEGDSSVFGGTSKLVELYFVRLMLGTLSCISLMMFKRSISKRFGNQCSFWFTLITISQFHLMYYISRPLPNIFALILVLIAYSNWLEGKINSMVSILTVSIFIFRSEVLVLAGPIVFCCLFIEKNLKFIEFLLVGIFSAMVSIGASVIVDSYFWRRPIYPEAEVFYFNTIENKSSEWGTSPFHWYFSTALPKSLALTLIFFIIGLFSKISTTTTSSSSSSSSSTSKSTTNRNHLIYLIPILIFVGLYSILPHKEIRFIFYSLPIINLVSAIGVIKVWNYIKSNDNKNSVVKMILSLFVIGTLIGNSILSIGFLYVSSLNYPGGHSMISLHNHLNLTDQMGLLLLLNQENNKINFKNCKVHIDNLAAISGVSRFNEFNENCIYSKKERDVNFNDYTYLIAPNTTSTNLGFKTIDSIISFDHIQFKKQFPFFEIIKKPSLFIMEKINK